MSCLIFVLLLFKHGFYLYFSVHPGLDPWPRWGLEVRWNRQGL